MQGNSKEVEYAYLAGIIDGEGAIFITRDLFRSKNPVYRVEVRVGMIQPNALKRLHDEFFGYFILEKPYHHRRPLHRWLLSNRDDIKNCLISLMPYLDVKKEQAELALEYIARFPRRNGHWQSENDLREKEEFWIKMRTLNGIASPATTERNGKRGRRKSVRLEAPV